MNKQRFDEWVQRLNSLRVRMSNAEVDYWEAMMEFEADEDAWSGAAYPTFDQVIHVKGLKSLHEYAKFKLCVKKLGGVVAVRKIGFAAAKELLVIPDDAPSKIDPSVPAVKAAFGSLASMSEKLGKEPAGQTGAAQVRKHYLPPPKPAEPKVENPFDVLKRKLKATEKQLAAAEKQLASAEKRVAELEKENAQLRERLSDGEKPGTARTSKKQGRNARDSQVAAA